MIYCGGMNQSGKGMNMHSKPCNEKERDGGSRAALTILNERYAKGELGREEYLKVREDILSDDKA